MCPPGYHNGSGATHELGHMMHGCSIVHHVPKCMSCHKVIVVITGRAHCFHDCIYITSVLLLWDLSTLCVVITYDHLCKIYIHRQVWAGITWYRCETLHVIFPCLALSVWSIPQSIELRRTFEIHLFYWFQSCVNGKQIILQIVA